MAQQYLLDTCAWIDLRVAPERVHEQALELARMQPILYLATISLVEIARKAATGHLNLHDPIASWLSAATNANAIRLLDISPEIAIEAYHLPGEFHKDPADRIIVATARVHQLTILTSDSKILNYPHVRSLCSRS